MNKIEMALERARDTKARIIGSGVVCRTAEMFQQIFPGQKVLPIYFKICIGVQLIHNVGLISGVQHNGSVMHMHISGLLRWR